MTELEATVIMNNGDRCAHFYFMGNPMVLPILNSEGCRIRDVISISYNGRDPYVRRIK